ncbi:hypothetical protein EC973_002731 [Apophysomyces ossiformis]|uniref:Uncharacterized protein n=1 Tax=Apophysomyces ossiformis TaxID=679940 RepID=A0A8H7BM83_9FUNG|nr:hypothetical protein EC973_002731 [Apophysomyces ossiformis]
MNQTVANTSLDNAGQRKAKPTDAQQSQKAASSKSTSHGDSSSRSTLWESVSNSLILQKSNPKKRKATDEESAVKDPWWLARYDDDGFYSVGALLFVFGFICPPLWWLGAFWPRRVHEHGGKMAERWQRLNRIASIGFSILLVLAIIIAASLYARHA